MCGIAGFVERRGAASPECLDPMVRSMFHRGPDGEGRYVSGSVALGMCRLAIIDPAHGQQPFSTDDGAIVAFQNGEIYNHRALRRELEAEGVRFETDSDSEILPHAYRVWGADGFARRLDGMFAIAILDEARRELHLYRDRFGEKPLFYRDDRTRFAFASQLTTLALDRDFGFEVDPVALRHYLFLHYVPGTRTIFESIRRLAPGGHLRIGLEPDASPEITTWLDETAPEIEPPGRYRSAVRETRARLEQAVASRLLADVPVGVFLSGGLDSSALAAAAARHVGQVRTFSVGFEDAELDESEHARAVASHLGAEHHHFRFDLAACLSVLDEAMCALDEPLGDPACLPVLLLAREARRHVKVVLSGEGADELFGGYGYYPDTGGDAATPTGNAVSFWTSRLASRFRRWGAGGGGARDDPSIESFFGSDRSERTRNATPSGFPGLTNRAERDRLVPGAAGDEDDWTRGLVDLLAGVDCGLRRAQLADVHSWLAGDLLPKFDRMTMAASLEGRAPYLDPRLADFALALPAGWKIEGERRKRVLQEAARPWLPAPISVRPKQGFVLPIQGWLVGPLRERLLDGLAGDRGDGLDADFARALAVEDIALGAPRARLLYGLLAYRDWMRALRERRALAYQQADARRA